MSTPTTTTDARLARLSASTGSTTTTTHEADKKASALLQPKEKSSVRRWLGLVRQVVFSNSARRQSASSSSERKSEESVAHTSSSITSSVVAIAPSISSSAYEDTASMGKVGPNTLLKHVARDQQASSTPAPASIPTSASTSSRASLCIASASVEEMKLLAHVPQTMEPSNVNDTMTTAPAKAKRSRKPRKPTMIGPEMMEKIAKDNKKHQGASAAREAELKKNSTGAVASAPGAKLVRANPLRWSEE